MRRSTIYILLVINFCALQCSGGVVLLAGESHARANSLALKDALDHAAAGDTIVIPSGTFRISGSVHLRSGINISGAGVAVTILSPSFDRAQPMVSGNGLAGVEIHDLTLDGAGDANVTQGIDLEKSTGVHCHDLVIMNLPGSDRTDLPLGPHAIDCTASVTNSRFESITCRSIGVGRTWGGGIRLSWNSSGNRISNCTVQNTGRGGIFCNDGSTDNIISGNTTSGSGGVGLGIEVQNCDRSLIEDNTIDHWLSVDNSSLSAVRRNKIGTSDKTFKLCGIELVDSHDVVVNGNTVSDGAKVGLSISGPKPKCRLLVTNNSFDGATTWGTQIQGEQGGAYKMYFAQNKFINSRLGPAALYPNQGHGVRINGDARWITFDQNEITHNAGVGLQITGESVDHLFFFGNLIAENRGGLVDSDPIDQLVFSQNKTLLPATAWEKRALNQPLPRHRLDVHGASMPASGGGAYDATATRPIHFAVLPQSEFVPEEALWDFGEALPVSGTTADHTFAIAGTFPVEVVSWDANGNAAFSQLIFYVR